MKKIYAVEASSGDHEDYRWWIHSIHEEEKHAEECMNILFAEVERIKNIPNPVYGTDDPIEVEDMTDADYAKHDKWATKKYRVADFNGAKIVEYTFGQVYTNWNKE